MRASGGSVNYYFGGSVAISNDNTIVVGAPHSTTGLPQLAVLTFTSVPKMEIGQNMLS